MAIKITSYDGCCNAYILYDFGGTALSAGYRGDRDIGVMRVELARLIRDYGRKMLTAITNDDQKVANALLRELGFRHSPWMSKRQHPETKVRLWWRQPDV